QTCALPILRAATSMFFTSRAKSLPRLASSAAFLCLVVAHFEWPAMMLLSFSRVVLVGRWTGPRRAPAWSAGVLPPVDGSGGRRVLSGSCDPTGGRGAAS